jgi:hypothetical protein
MNLNEASWDHIALVVLGVALILGGLLAAGGTGGYIMAGVGLIPLITGLMGGARSTRSSAQAQRRTNLPRLRPSSDLETPRTR